MKPSPFFLGTLGTVLDYKVYYTYFLFFEITYGSYLNVPVSTFSAAVIDLGNTIGSMKEDY